MEYPTAGGRILSGSGSASKEAAPVISRRGVVRAAAWSAPVIAAAIAAPLAAASTPTQERGLNGWVQFRRWENDKKKPDTLELDGRGSRPDRGFWVWPTTTSSTITDAKIEFYIDIEGTDDSDYSLTWTGTSSTWSQPTKTGTVTIDSKVYGVYESKYTGAVTPTDPDTTLQNSDFYYTASLPRNAGTVRIYAVRTVTLDGEVISFRRGPIALES